MAEFPLIGVHLLVPMLLSKAFNLTASSPLESDSAPASTSFDVYLIILSTCTHPCSSGICAWASTGLLVLTQRHEGFDFYVCPKNKNHAGLTDRR